MFHEALVLKSTVLSPRPNAVDLKTSPAFYAFQSTIYWEDFWLLWALKLWDVLAYNT